MCIDRQQSHTHIKQHTKQMHINTTTRTQKHNTDTNEPKTKKYSQKYCVTDLQREYAAFYST